MRKNVFGRKLKRDTNERKALFKGLITSLVLYERIETTEAKAKAVRPTIEKLVTIVKKKGIVGKDRLRKYIASSAIDTFVTEVAPRFQSRNGGYTRIIKTGHRIKDNAPMALIEWVEGKVQNAEKEAKKTARRTRKEKTPKPKRAKKEKKEKAK